MSDDYYEKINELAISMARMEEKQDSVLAQLIKMNGKGEKHEIFVERAKGIGIVLGLLFTSIIAWLSKVTLHVFGNHK